MIEIQLTHKLGGITLDVDVTIPSSGITAIFGRSGSGKTSFINTIAGLITPDSGRIKLGERLLFDSRQGVDLAIEKRDIGYVFQDSRLFPHYSVKGNLLYGVKENHQKSEFDRIVDLLNLSHLLERYPAALSGGERQRVAIARALLSNPQVLLMDEPLASLDLPRKKEVMPFLEKLSKQVNIPILYVTHSLSEILRLADQMVLLESGRVIACDSLESIWASDVMRPWHSFSDQSSLFEARIHSHHEKYALSKVELNTHTHIWVQKLDAEPGEELRLQVRANDVSITLEHSKTTSIRNILPARVIKIEKRESQQGNQSAAVLLHLADECQLWANITHWALDDLQLTEGQQVFAQIKGVSVTQRDMAIKPILHNESELHSA